MHRLLVAVIGLLLAACAGGAWPISSPGTAASPDPLDAADRALAVNDLAAADRDLQAVVPDRLSTAQRAHYLLLRAQLLFAADQPVAATATLVAREHLLRDPQAIRDNRDLIWTELSKARLDAAELSHLAQADRMTRGWIELAQLARRGAGLRPLTDWRRRYPDHPGADKLAGLMMPGTPAAGGPAPTLANWSAPAPGPGPTALLLPISGAFAGAAAMIRAGFAAAAPPGSPEAQAQVVDTAGGLPALRQAEATGAGLIVGPLSKSQVAQAAAGPLTLPVLALNYLDPGSSGEPGLYQFGLAPEDEVRQIVERAAAAGRMRAIALVTDDDRGNRILAALRQALTQHGGALIAAARYAPGTVNFQLQVRQLLDTDDSYARLQALTRTLGTRPEFTPRRRRDVDFIFIAARPTAARLIWPMFRFYGADDLPIYATSEVADNGPDPDLAGIRYCGAPWLVEQDASWVAVRQQILAAAGNTDSGRLYALGMDAARLAARIRGASLVPAGTEIAGDTGALSLAADGVIRRHLACARLQADAVESLDAAPLPLP
ncbi:MAG: penicillin-binding protein activator [Gammaproteobacteria bacterium]|nr:penicillin-binding protein activator [Gammaproteobacteria bacterium]